MYFQEFKTFYTDYLALKDYDEETIESVLEHLSRDSAETYPDSDVMVDILCMLLFKDIICGIWNETVTVENAMYQLVTATDIHLALKGYLYETVDSSKLTHNFKIIVDRMSSIQTPEDAENFYAYLKVDTSWMPVQKEFRTIYAFLLMNMVCFVQFDMSYIEYIDSE